MCFSCICGRRWVPHSPTLPPWFVVFSLLSHVWLFVIQRTAACKASLSFTISWSLLKFMSIESVMPFNYLVLCCPLLLLPSFFPSIRVFFSESALHMTWPKNWSFSFSIIPSKEVPGLISFRMDWCVFAYSVTQLCLTLCHPMDCRTSGFSVFHYLLEFAQTPVHWISDAIHHFILCHPLLLLPCQLWNSEIFLKNLGSISLKGKHQRR